MHMYIHIYTHIYIHIHIHTQGMLGSDVFEDGEVPVIGVGHSLGCKVHVLLNSLPEARQAAGRERAANVHIAFNNFGAKQSIPILSELAEMQRSFQQVCMCVCMYVCVYINMHILLRNKVFRF